MKNKNGKNEPFGAFSKSDGGEMSHFEHFQNQMGVKWNNLSIFKIDGAETDDFRRSEKLKDGLTVKNSSEYD